ncbi:hypothetical protein GOP47_0029403 [Adiantum capillus-veneris]|nr:hypothetical protein GOP47_0029403 [Adiantum capillus-veneris]
MVVYCWGTQGNAANNYVPPSLRAGMGLCVNQCDEGEYELRDSELGISDQCPGDGGLKKIVYHLEQCSAEACK